MPSTALGRLAWNLTHKPKLTITALALAGAVYAVLHFVEEEAHRAYEKFPRPEDVLSVSTAMDPWDDDPELEPVARPELYRDLIECLDACRATASVPGESIMAIVAVETKDGERARMTLYVDGMLTVGSQNYEFFNVNMARSILSAM